MDYFILCMPQIQSSVIHVIRIFKAPIMQTFTVIMLVTNQCTLTHLFHTLANNIVSCREAYESMSIKSKLFTFVVTNSGLSGKGAEKSLW